MEEHVPAPPPRPVELVPGSPEWVAIDESVRRVESAFNLNFRDLHKRLDQMGMQGRPLAEVLAAVARATGMPEFYAWMVVRSYPGIDRVDADSAKLRAYLASRKR